MTWKKGVITWSVIIKLLLILIAIGVVSFIIRNILRDALG
tara:strand:- start:166 stop:285 length:120 start_codon:yes stop_codon:yes gene_type:complete